MNPKRRQAGFTMVELVVCIVVLGILAAFTAPRLLDSSTLATRTYSDEVASALREAQAVAVASGCDVAIDLNATSYVARQRSAAGNQCSPAGACTVNVLRGDGSALSGSAPSSVTLVPATRIVFDLHGQPISGAPPLLQIDHFRISVDAISGLVIKQ